MKLYEWFNTHACLNMVIFLKSLITYLIQVGFYSAHSMKSRRWQISINQAMMFIGSKDSPPFHNFGLIDNPKLPTPYGAKEKRNYRIIEPQLARPVASHTQRALTQILAKTVTVPHPSLAEMLTSSLVIGGFGEGYCTSHQPHWSDSATGPYLAHQQRPPREMMTDK